MKARWLLLLVLLTAIIGFASGCGGGGGDDGDDSNGGSEAVPADAVAVVAGTSILKADFDRFFSQREKAAEAQGQEFPQPGTPEYADLQNQAVDFLVQRVEFAREAEALGIKVTDESVDQRLEELKNQFFEGDDAKYEAELTTLGLTDADVRADLRAQLISEQLFAEVTKDITVTADDVKTYYDENTDQFKSAESRDVAHILVETKKEADDIYQQLQDGADFETLAGKHSLDDASAENGGQLTDERGTFVPEFEEVAFSLGKNQISIPIKTQYGWHIIQALSKTKKGTTTPFNQVKEPIRQQLAQDKKNKEMEKWVADMRKDLKDDTAYQVGYKPTNPNSSTAG